MEHTSTGDVNVRVHDPAVGEHGAMSQLKCFLYVLFSCAAPVRVRDIPPHFML